MTPAAPDSPEEMTPQALELYRAVMTTLNDAGLPFLVGGTHAFARYTGIVRNTKDFDIFVHPRDFDRVLETLEQTLGCETKRPFPHWLGKACKGEDFVDVIFSSGNGIARVDDLWYEHAVEEEVLGIRALISPAEEMIWSKSFILERERCDIADVAHILRARAGDIDWDRLVSRFGENGPVLLAQLVLFQFIYPEEAKKIPEEVLTLLKAAGEQAELPADHLCRGTLLSRSQFLVDVERFGYQDARVEPVGPMSEEEVEIWTKAAERETGLSYTDVEKVEGVEIVNRDE